MQLTEIGSEFWNYTVKDDPHEKYPEWLNIGTNKRSFVSGRTALHHIISDIRADQVFESVYLPSYCCHSMIEPFISNGIKVMFYDVVADVSGGIRYNIDFKTSCNAVLVMSYFGFGASETDSVIRKFMENGKKVIEDLTHSIFCSRNHTYDANYSFASLRKWFAVPGYAIASKSYDNFSIGENLVPHSCFLELRNRGMHLKSRFLQGRPVHKKEFLDIFHESEMLLSIDYKDYGTDKMSDDIVSGINVQELTTRRRDNAFTLIKGLKDNKNFKLLFSDIKENDCPLFVPVICNKNVRDRLKQYLIDNQIYCPSHWPVSEFHALNESSSSLYENELSLICDQRYNKDDMERIIRCVTEFHD